MRTTHLSYRQQARGPSRSHSRLRVSRVTAMIAMFLVAVAMLVQAGSTGVQRAAAADTCTVSWNVDVSGNWSNPANWSPEAVPGPTDDVCIDRTGADVTGKIDIPAVVNSLTSTDNIVLPSSSSLELAAVSGIAGNLTTAGGLTAADLTLSGVTDWSGWDRSGAVTNNGTIQIIASSGRSLTGSLLNDTGALVEQDPTLTLLDGATIINRGIWDFTGSGDLAAPAASVLALTPPANDDLSNATVLGTDDGSLVGETNVDASAEVGEPSHNGVTPSRSVWYQWTPAVDGNAVVGATTHPYATWNIVMGVYTGTAVDALTEVTAGGDPMSVALEVEFRVEAGTTYYMAIDGRTSSETGSFDLTWSIPSPPNDDFSEATTLTAASGWLLGETNEWATAEPGEPNHDEVIPSRSVWYDWSPSADGTAVVKGSTRPYSDNYIVMAAYTGAAVDALTEVAAWGGPGFTNVRLEFELVGGTTYHIVLDGTDESETGSFDLTWALSPPANDDFADATVLTGRSGTLLAESNERATAEIGEPTHDGVAGTPARSVWYEWTPTWDEDATIDVAIPLPPDDWDSVVAVYTGSSLDALTEVVATSMVGDSLHLEFEVVGGTTYRLAVDGHDTDNWGSFDLTWANEPFGGTFIVTKTEDTDDGMCDTDCSLREAVVAANATGGDDTIHLPAGIYQLTLDYSGVAEHYGSLDIARETGTTTIIGAGRDVTVVDATTLRTVGVSFPDRVFTVGYHAGLELVGVTVTGGYMVSGADKDGGGILNSNGYLTVTDCLIEGNVSGGNGGGIANYYGTATITNTIVRDNNTDPPEYNTTGYGGGIYNSGTMSIMGSTIDENQSDNGGGVASEKVLDDYPPFVDIINSSFTGNSARRGGGVANLRLSEMTVTDSLITGNHATRNWDVGTNTLNRGGGILNWAATLTVTRSTITGNEARATHAYDPASGGGGGIANDLGDLTVIDTTVSGNEAICDQKLYGDPDLCGRGGGILNAGGYASVVNSTISGNTTALLNSNHSPYLGGGGGGGFAHMPQLSGVTIFCPVTVLDSVTITDNTGAHGGGVNTRWETKVGLLYDVVAWRVGTNANGHPILECADLYVMNTIVAGNTATFTAGTEDSWGDYTSLGHNLVGDGTGCPSDGSGDIVAVDALLGPLADNGGPTFTHALLAGSPARDAGDTALATDQRGVARPQGPADDIGAFEGAPTTNTRPILDPIGVQTVAEGATLEVAITASDPDSDPLTFTLSGEPVFAALVDHGDGTATLSLTPGFDDAGVYPGVIVTVSDSVDSDSETFTITVTVEAPMHLLFLPLVLQSH